MTLQPCLEFYASITRHFAFLFEAYHFHLADDRQEKSGEYCLVILSSTDCQARFVAEQNGVDLALGPMDAPPIWGNFVDGR